MGKRSSFPPSIDVLSVSCCILVVACPLNLLDKGDMFLFELYRDLSCLQVCG